MNKKEEFEILKKIFRNLTFIFLWIVQLLIFCASFFVFTSTIKMFPWYEPLTMGGFFLLLFLVPIQMIITLVFIFMHNETLIPKVNNIISIINLGILISILFITTMNEDLFYPFAIFYSVLESLLIVSWSFSLIKWSIKKINKNN